MQVSVKRAPAKGDGATAERILDLAERLVQTRGFHGCSYADIAAELGITRAALHYHFGSKAELGVALIERYHRRFRARLDEIDAYATSPTRRLEEYAGIYRAVFADGRMCLCGMLAVEFVTLDEPLRDALGAFFDTNYGWLTALLSEGRDSGAMSFSGDARATAELVVSTLEGAMLLGRPSGDVTRFDAMVAGLLTQFAPTAPRRRARRVRQ